MAELRKDADGNLMTDPAKDPPEASTSERGRERAEPTGKELAKKAAEDREEKAKPPIIRICPKGALFLEGESNSPNGRGTWYACIPHDHTIEDVLSPQYFGTFQSDTGGLRPGDVIDVEPESGLWELRVRVMAKVPKLSQIKVRERAGSRQYYGVKCPQGVTIEWRGGHAKWVLKKGGVDVDAGFDNQEEALARYEQLSKDKAA